MVACGKGIVRDLEMDMYTLLYLKWVTNKDLLYSTWNSAQYYVAAGWEGVWGRMETCICMAESLCCSPETITILLISYTLIQEKSSKQIKISCRKANILRYADDTPPIAGSEEELKSLLMGVKEESEKTGLKFSIQKTIK